jgi:hypothetical protein
MQLETKKILGLGHPRTGTKYTSNLLKSWGLDIGHEALGKDGIVAWQLATNESKLPFMEKAKNVNYNSFLWDTKIYIVRNPKESLPSIVYTEKGSIPFRSTFLDGEYKKDNWLLMSIKSILKWNDLILEKKPDFIFRIESDGKNLFEFLKQKYDITWNDSEIGKVQNSRVHSKDIEHMKKVVDDETKQKLNEFCIRMRYDPFF